MKHKSNNYLIESNKKLSLKFYKILGITCWISERDSKEFIHLQLAVNQPYPQIFFQLFNSENANTYIYLIKVKYLLQIKLFYVPSMFLTLFRSIKPLKAFKSKKRWNQVVFNLCYWRTHPFKSYINKLQNKQFINVLQKK